ncbi:MAG: YqaJ viral recombinase family protein [Alphaproteobacteria bacterium]|nr:YqaJ viral recombinase family protein [Alphaproteobacteria bacterium]
MEQGTEEWFAARCGKVTASRVADVIAKTKSGWGASRANYMAQLIAERLTNTVADSYTNAAMQWGSDTEPRARLVYELKTGALVEQVGFVDHPIINNTGASPDGLVGTEGMTEIKCPNTATHIDTLLNEKVPGKYITQMQWQMACAERDWCDFVSFDPRMPEHLNIWIHRIERDEEKIAELENLVAEFLEELRDKVEALNNIEKEAAA